MDWTSWLGFQLASNIITLLAATRLIPSPPALVEIRYNLILWLEALLKYLQQTFLVSAAVLPSNLEKKIKINIAFKTEDKKPMNPTYNNPSRGSRFRWYPEPPRSSWLVSPGSHVPERGNPRLGPVREGTDWILEPKHKKLGVKGTIIVIYLKKVKIPLNTKHKSYISTAINRRIFQQCEGTECRRYLRRPSFWKKGQIYKILRLSKIYEDFLFFIKKRIVSNCRFSIKVVCRIMQQRLKRKL